MLRHLGRRTYYMGSLVHPSSYALLAKYCGEVWPRREQPVPPELLAFMDGLATEFGLEKVDAANPLLREVGWRTRESEVEQDYWRQCDKPSARFFIGGQPALRGRARAGDAGAGDGGQHPERAARARRRSLRKPMDALRALARRLPGGAKLRRSEMVAPAEGVAALRALRTQALESLAASAQVMELPAGRYVFRKGDASDELYLLARGAAYVLAEKAGARTGW